MAGEIGAVGDIADGFMLARAAEPHAGETPAGHAGALCLNCGTRLIGAHCHRCGQSGHVHRTVGAIGHELLHGVFHFEGKIWRTLPMLALRPGELTRRYVHGERARFVSPMAIFLFSVFLLFAVVAQLPGWHIGDASWMNTGGVAKARDAIAQERRQATKDAADIRGDIAEEQREARPDATKIAKLQAKLAKTEGGAAQLARTEQMLPASDSLGGVSGRSKSDWLNEKWRHAKENPQLLLYKLKSSAYKFSWALIPISLPFIWLLFPFRRGVGLYDHAVFATYSLSFMSLLVVTLAVLSAVGVPGGWIAFAAILVPPLHIYKQLKGGYRLSRLGTLWRTAVMLLFATITSTLFVLLLLYLGTAE